MGCNHSRNQIGVNPSGGAAPGTAPSTPKQGSPVKIRSRPASTTTILVHSKSTDDLTTTGTGPYENRLLRRRLLKQSTWTGSHDNINTLGTRGGSATSKFSTHSGDSGFGDHKFITEDSKPEDVKAVEESFRDPSSISGIGVVGTAVPRTASGKQRGKEQSILEGLRQDGLIARPVQQATSGLSFEVVAADLQGDSYLVARKPPARLAKLEKRAKKKKVLTEEEIKAKMERVERKRQEREQAKLEKIRAVTQKSDIQNALDSFMETQVKKEETQKTKEEIAAENREKRMKEMRDKLRQKQEHANKVRHRRKTTEEAVDFSENPPFAAKVITEDTPVGPSTSQS